MRAARRAAITSARGCQAISGSPLARLRTAPAAGRGWRTSGPSEPSCGSGRSRSCPGLQPVAHRDRARSGSACGSSSGCEPDVAEQVPARGRDRRWRGRRSPRRSARRDRRGRPRGSRCPARARPSASAMPTSPPPRIRRSRRFVGHLAAGSAGVACAAVEIEAAAVDLARAAPPARAAAARVGAMSTVSTGQRLFERASSLAPEQHRHAAVIVPRRCRGWRHSRAPGRGIGDDHGLSRTTSRPSGPV